MASAKKVLRVNPRWCKGCGICVAFCPMGVLELRKGKVAMAYPDKCVGCGMCEQRCPDYAVYLEERGEE